MGGLSCQCRGNGFVPASKTHPWFVMDCPSCGGPPETLEEQNARQRDHIADLTANLQARDREIRELRAEQNAALYREGVLS